MAHNSIAVLSITGEHSHYIDRVTAHGLIHSGLAHPTLSASGNKVKHVQMLARNIATQGTWHRKVSGGFVVRQLDPSGARHDGRYGRKQSMRIKG